MIIKFDNYDLELLYEGQKPKRKPKYPEEVITSFKKKVKTMENVSNAEELRQFTSLRFERLNGNKKDLYSIRVNDQYRIEFRLDNEIIKLAELATIEDLSKHYR
jgi:Plasmid maintenance system killer protein